MSEVKALEAVPNNKCKTCDALERKVVRLETELIGQRNIELLLRRQLSDYYEQLIEAQRQELERLRTKGV